MISQIPEGPRQVISLDLMGPLPRGQLGMRYILAAVDIFSKHTKLYALRKATTDAILNKIVQDYIPTFGSIQKILTDNGTQFTSRKWTEELKKLGVKAIFTTSYYPESNPVERVNREIGRILRAYCFHKHSTWVKWLENIEFWLNNTTHHSTGFTPQQLTEGKRYRLSIDKFIEANKEEHPEDVNWIIKLAKEKLHHHANQRNIIKDKNKKSPTYEKGQLVLIREHRLSSASDKEIHKFFLLYHGPYPIVQVRDNNTVVIETNEGRQFTYNYKNIKQYHPPDPGEVISQ